MCGTPDQPLHKLLAQVTPVNLRKLLRHARKLALINQQALRREPYERLLSNVMMYTYRQISFLTEVIESTN